MENLISALATPRRLANDCSWDAVVNHHLQVVHFDDLVPKIRQHGEGQVAVHDGAFEGAFGPGAFYVDVYPLVVGGGIGEEVDAFLRYFYVVGDAYLLAYQFFKIFIRIDNYFFHSSLQVFSDYDAYDWSSPAGG